MLLALQLKTILPHCDVDKWIAPLSAAMAEFGLTTPKRMAMFLAQIGHESAHGRRLIENLDYSADGLMKTFPKYFHDRRDAALCAHRPYTIAERIYGGRLGNRSAGDGYRFRGRGLIQITGRANYEAVAAALGIDCVEQPDLLIEPIHAARSAAWFFTQRIPGIELADKQDLKTCSIRINGGLTGYQDRLAIYLAACSTLVSAD